MRGYCCKTLGLALTGLFFGVSSVSAEDLMGEVTRLSNSVLSATEWQGYSARIQREALINDPAPSLLMPDGQVHRLQLDSEIRHASGLISVSGQLVNLPDSRVGLVLADDAVAGYVFSGAATIEIQPLGDDRVRVVELVDEAFAECGGAEDASAQANAEAAFFSSAGPAPADVRGGTVEIDVMVVYTQEAQDGAGGESAIQAVSQAAVDAMNTSLQNSLVDAHVNLVYNGLVDYTETGNSASDLSWLRNNATVAQLRDNAGADMVSMLVNDFDACGRGYVMRNPGVGFAGSAYQVTHRNCAVGNLSFAHEFGHNMGLEHDPANGTSPAVASFPWSFGHFHSGSYRTVMAYSNQCTGGCTRNPFYSNPDVNFMALPTGIVDERDNARSLRATASIVAQFRAPPVDLIYANGFDPSL